MKRKALVATVAPVLVAPLLAAAMPAAEAERGSDGQLRIRYWQAPSILNPYLTGGTKDLEAASLVLEPLARFDESGRLIPWLAESVPTVANGGISADLQVVTWTLRENLLWSDGSPVTAADVVFTARYCLDPAGGCAQRSRFGDVAVIEAMDDRTVMVSFDVPKPYPYGPFVSESSPILQKEQFADCIGARASACTEANGNPIGTGPFRVTDFQANKSISLEANPYYRDPAKPAFETVVFKGGGDAETAARAVLETGEFDYAANLQIAPDLLRSLEAVGKGKVVSGFGTTTEQLMINLTNPDPELGDERSTRVHAHPFLSDRSVRQALSMAIDRRHLVEIGYGPTGRATCRLVPVAATGGSSTAGKDCLKQDQDGARRVLDAAGWHPGADGIRQKDGVRLSVLFQTSTNRIRQDFQALLKQWWSEIGVETELRDLDASIFFGGDPQSADTNQKFFADIQMYTTSFDGADPEPYFNGYRCGEEPRPATQWQGSNIPRYCSEAYDQLLDTLAKTADSDARANLIETINNQLVEDYVLIPLVDRGYVSAHAQSLGGVLLNVNDSALWNIADWHRLP